MPERVLAAVAGGMATGKALAVGVLDPAAGVLAVGGVAWGWDDGLMFKR
jgi:hypothetical protein